MIKLAKVMNLSLAGPVVERNISFFRPRPWKGRLLLRFSRIAAGCLLLSVCVGCDQQDSSPSSSIEQAKPHPALWLDDQSASYTFALTSSTSLGGLPSSGAVEVVGKVRISSQAGSDGVMTLNFRPSDLSLTRPSDADKEAVKGLLEDLEQPFGVELKQGALVAYLEPEGSALLAFGLRRQLAVLAQRAQPGKPGAEEWTGLEWDASGQAQVSYKMDPTKPGTSLWKKTGYKKTLANQASHAALQEQSWEPEVIKSEGFISTDNLGVVAIERSESLRTEMTPGQYLQSSYVAKLKRLESSKAPQPPAPEDVIRRTAGSPLPPMDTSVLDAIRFAGKTWDEVLASLPSEKSGSKASFSARQAAFNGFVGLFRTDEENIKKAQVLIDARDPRSSTLLRALASASTESSLKVLSGISLNKARPAAERASAAATFLRAEVPPPSAVKTLEKFVDDPLLKETGLLGLGTFGRLWRKAGQTEAAEKAALRLAAELKRAKSPEEQERCLFAIANSGDARFFERAVELQSSSDPKVREAAIQAIRLMKEDRVEGTLTALLQGTQKPAEQVSILAALAQRKRVSEATVKLVESSTDAKLDAEVRRQAVLTLGAWRAKWPRVLDVLKRLATSDTDARVREAAQLKSL